MENGSPHVCVVCGVADPSLWYKRASFKLPCCRSSVAEFFFDYSLHDILELSSVEEASGRFLCLDCFEIVSECDENEEDQSRMVAGLKQLIMRGSRAVVKRRRLANAAPTQEMEVIETADAEQETVEAVQGDGVEEAEVSQESSTKL
jgi:hypothetical protein